jgi:excisionase family DNA binding protein
MVAKKFPDKDKTIFTSSEACGYMNICWNSLKKLINDGDIPVVRVGRRYLIPKEGIDKFMNKDNLLAESIAKSICL